MLPIKEPVADVLGTIPVLVSALAMRFVIQPLTLVDIAILVNEATSPIGSVIFPVPYVLAAVFPQLDASALPIASHSVPLPEIYRSIVKFKRTTVLEMILLVHSRIGRLYSSSICLVRIVYELAHPPLSVFGLFIRIIGHAIYFSSIPVHTRQIIRSLPLLRTPMIQLPGPLPLRHLPPHQVPPHKCLRPNNNLPLNTLPPLDRHVLLYALNGSLRPLGSLCGAATRGLLPYTAPWRTRSICRNSAGSDLVV